MDYCNSLLSGFRGCLPASDYILLRRRSGTETAGSSAAELTAAAKRWLLSRRNYDTTGPSRFPAKHGKRYHVSVTVFKFWPHWLPVPARIKHKPSVSCLSQLLPGLFLIPCHGFSRPGNGGGVHPGFRVASVGVLQTYGLIRTSHSQSESFVHWPENFLVLLCAEAESAAEFSSLSEQ